MKIGLNKENLIYLNSAQKKLVCLQWIRHQHADLTVDYDISGEKDILHGFKICKNVWNPLIASGRYHARYLFYHNSLFYNKTVIEIGTGSGLMGVVMAKYGAKNVIMTDISSEAIKNTIRNVKKYGLSKRVSVIKGDLFEHIKTKADLITWMIPFFPGTTPPGDTIASSMIMEPKLFERFLVDAKKYLKINGVILIPSYSLGGSLTDPQTVAPKFGYNVKTTWLHNSVNNIQRGMIYMHELTLSR